MELVGTIYRMWERGANPNTRYFERQEFKKVLTHEGFRWTESSENKKLEIHDGGDILNNNEYKVGELEGNFVRVFGSSKLENFLKSYEN